jgi:hypothetical protein
LVCRLIEAYGSLASTNQGTEPRRAVENGSTRDSSEAARSGGHAARHGFNKKIEKAIEIIIKDQQDRIFHGVIMVNRAQHKGKSTFSGIIAKDNKTIYIAGHEGATRIGTIDGPDDITLYVLIPGGKKPRAIIADLKRMK